MKKSLRKGLTLVAITAMCAMGFTGCGESQTTSGETNNNEVADASTEGESEGTSGEAYKIGGMGPLTGDYASYGTSVKQGAEIAINEINAAGGVNGHNLELIFEDDECDEEKAISAYNKVMDEGAMA
ncbi:MAG: ABC transporter substrate-binding protein, partial [Cellulosilyticum sp.]|nr:ABC transporter substrate-binding protein [Cellulosilyticum sp.]